MSEVTETESKKSYEMKGWLFKWANLVVGFRRRWFVLSNGALSYYRDKDELNKNCRGTIPLYKAYINIINDCSFAVSNGDKLTFHIKAENVDELQLWVSAIKSAKFNIMRGTESESEDEKTKISEVFSSTKPYEKAGWLCKYVDACRDYKKYWFVLSSGFLNFATNQAEKNSSLETISLHNVQISTVNSCELSIYATSEENLILLRASSIEECEAWVTALKLSQNKAKADFNKQIGVKKDGWLFKYTNYCECYEQRWFVVSNGVLKYINRIEKNPIWKTISLLGAQIITINSCSFSILVGNNTQPILFKTTSTEERESWVNAIKANTLGAVASGNKVEKITTQTKCNVEINSAISDVTNRLKDLHTCNDVNTKNGFALQHDLTNLDTMDYTNVKSCTNIVNKSLSNFCTSSDAMIKACNDFLCIVESEDSSWIHILQRERQQRQVLENIVEQLTN